jgi:hypothetical protein
MAEPPESLGLTGALFDRIKDFFRQMWANVWEIDPTVFIPFWNNVSIALTDKLEERVVTHLALNLNKQLATLNIPAEIKTNIATLTADNDVGSLMLGYLMTFSYYTSYIGGHAAVSSELASHQWRSQYKPTIPDVATLIIALYRDPAKQTAVRDMLHKSGFTDERIDILFAASKSILAPDEYKNLFLRGEIDDATLTAGYKKYGFNDAEIAHLKTLFYPIPAYPDLVRMAVREAFYPDYIEEYGLLQELPGEFLEYAGKQGLSEEWAKRFWASHWELPSILQGFEMLHRNVITAEQLNSLFMATDVMPWWREKLQAISYNPLTRVDVRRVFKMGIINRDQVYRTYLDLGYDEEKAEWLTAFTEMQNTEQDRDLTKAEILSSYSKAIIGRSECRTMLIDLGYSEDEVNVLISMKEYTTVKEIKDREEKRIRKFYLAGAYTANQVINELGKLDLVGAEQESLLKLWDSEKLAKLKSPSKKELDTLFTNKIIDEHDYVLELKNLGYTQKYIDWYLALIAMTEVEG